MTPINVVSSHLIPVKEANLKNLEKQLEDLKNSNQSLLKELKALSDEATGIKTDISGSIDNLEKYSDLAKDSNLNERLRKLIEYVSTEEREQHIL